MCDVRTARPGVPGVTLSLVICTRNRATYLDRLLHSLYASPVPEGAEIIVVNNASTDGTAELLAKLGSEMPRLRAMAEEVPGSSVARNTGCRAASGQYFAFLDDDCVVPEGWLARVLDAVRGDGYGMVGGPYFATYVDPKPTWFKDAYGSSARDGGARPLARCETLEAGNMAVRRDLFERLGGFDTRLGIHGSRRGYQEEVVLQRRLRWFAPEEVVLYNPDLWVYHTVRRECMSVRWQARYRWQLGWSTYTVWPDAFRSRGRLALLSEIAKTAYSLVRCLDRCARRDRSRYLFWRNYAVEAALPVVEHLARLAAQWSAPDRGEDLRLLLGLAACSPGEHAALR